MVSYMRGNPSDEKSLSEIADMAAGMGLHDLAALLRSSDSFPQMAPMFEAVRQKVNARMARARAKASSEAAPSPSLYIAYLGPDRWQVISGGTPVSREGSVEDATRVYRQVASSTQSHVPGHLRSAAAAGDIPVWNGVDARWTVLDEAPAPQRTQTRPSMTNEQFVDRVIDETARLVVDEQVSTTAELESRLRAFATQLRG